MLGLFLEPECKQEQVLELSLCGGLTTSVFKISESKLISSLRVQKALKFIGRRKNMERYKSMMDFIFCEIWIAQQTPCFKFYEGNGPALRESMPTKEIKYYDKMIAKALDIALDLLKKYEEQEWSKKQVHWVAFRTAVLKKAA